MVSKCLMWRASTAAMLEVVSAKTNAPGWRRSSGKLNEATALDAAITFLSNAGHLRRAASEFVGWAAGQCE